MRTIDIHSHLAWGIDDGLDSKSNAVEAIQQAKRDGVERIIATPHFIPGRQSEKETTEMNQRIDELKQLAETAGIQVYRGCEIFLNDQYLEMLDAENFNTLAGSGYVLCEFDVRKNIDENDQAEDMLYEFSVRDMIPVIAHAERYFHRDLDVNRVKEWCDLGYVIQINRTSLLGLHGSQIKKNAWKLLKLGYAHIIASDAHQVNGDRICKLSDVYELVRDELGEDNAQILFYRNPLHIIENEEIEELEVVRKKPSLFNRMKRRR